MSWSLIFVLSIDVDSGKYPPDVRCATYAGDDVVLRDCHGAEADSSIRVDAMHSSVREGHRALSLDRRQVTERLAR